MTDYLVTGTTTMGRTALPAASVEVAIEIWLRFKAAGWSVEARDAAGNSVTLEQLRAMAAGA
jgi:hypothetical protein